MDPDVLDPDPLVTLRTWIDEAAAAGAAEPTAMSLATVDAEGVPDARFVLLKGIDARGLRFFTNLDSPKARQLRARPVAAVALHLEVLHRQVRARGEVTPVDDAEADAYFATRARSSQLGAWASHQSEPIGARADLEAALAAVEARFADGPVPRPPRWGGFVLRPTTVELWEGRTGRLHDRLRYDRDGPGWTVTRLQP